MHANMPSRALLNYRKSCQENMGSWDRLAAAILDLASAVYSIYSSTPFYETHIEYDLYYGDYYGDFILISYSIVCESINQSVNQSINQSIHQSTKACTQPSRPGCRAQLKPDLN